MADFDELIDQAISRMFGRCKLDNGDFKKDCYIKKPKRRYY